MCLIVGIRNLSSEKEISEGDAKIQLVFDLGLSSAVERHLFGRNPDTDRSWHHLKDSRRNIMMENVLRKG